MGAVGNTDTAITHRDEDLFDEYCDHLLVLDGECIIGTYRLLLDSNASLASGYLFPVGI